MLIKLCDLLQAKFILISLLFRSPSLGGSCHFAFIPLRNSQPRKQPSEHYKWPTRKQSLSHNRSPVVGEGPAIYVGFDALKDCLERSEEGVNIIFISVR